MAENTIDWTNCIPPISEYSSSEYNSLDEKMAYLNEQMAQFVGRGFTSTPIEKIEIKPYDFTVEDEID